MFSELNTEGFSASDIDLLNAALAVRMERGEDEKSATDKINNAWFDGATIADLTK